MASVIIPIDPASGGRLRTRLSAERPGALDYTIKRDFRRELDQEIRREGFDYFYFDPSTDIGNQPFPQRQGLLETNLYAASRLYMPVATYSCVMNGNLFYAGCPVNINDHDLTSKPFELKYNKFHVLRSSIPINEVWNTGDMALNDMSITVTNIGWVNTVGGTPGTWKAYGPIEP